MAQNQRIGAPAFVNQVFFKGFSTGNRVRKAIEWLGEVEKGATKQRKAARAEPGRPKGIQICRSQPLTAQPVSLVSQSGHAGEVRQLAATRDNRLLVSGGADGSLRIWDLAAGLLRRTIYAHGGAVQALALDPRGELAASAGEDRYVRIWRLADGSRVWEKRIEGMLPVSITWSADGGSIAAAGQALLVAGRDGREIARSVPAFTPYSVAWLPRRCSRQRVGSASYQ